MSGVAEELGVVASRLTMNVMPVQTGESNLVRFSLGQAGRAMPRVHDATGRVVRTLYANPATRPGACELNWDRSDQTGKEVGAGIYFFRLETPSATVVRKALLLRWGREGKAGQGM